jgi:glycosyltransferase involved in cell wall biosynthesis
MSDDAGEMSTSFLLICHSYPPVIGGSELEAQRVCAALTRRGHNATVVCAGGHPMPPLRDWIDPEGVRVRIYAGRWKGRLKDIVFALRVLGMLIRERENYDFVYFLMQGLHLAVGLPAARLLGKPILMKIAGSTVVPLMTSSFIGRLELKWLRKWAYRVMILNDGIRREALTAGFPERQLCWMPNPVDTDEFRPATEEEKGHLREELGIPPGAAVVLYCGRLAPGKALAELLDAFALAARQLPKAMLVVVGDGPLMQPLVENAAKLGLEHSQVKFTGQVAPNEVSRWLKVADTFALVSFNEGLPCALIEAMSTGLSCVVSDIPANRQLVDDDTHGFLTPVGDIQAISQAIMQLLTDVRLRLRMGLEARRRIIEDYSTDRVVDLYEGLFRQMLSESRPNTTAMHNAGLTR